MELGEQLAALDLGIALERLGGDRTLLRELAGLFLEDTGQLLDELRTAMANGDALRLQRAAHTLKGSVSIFGAERTFQAALRLEQLGRHGDLSAARDALVSLESEIELLTPALAALAAEPA